MYKLKKLSSGLKILTIPMKNTEIFTLLVLVGTGSQYETKKINGISHFLEHMFFKGTKDRPEPGQVHRELDSFGAQHNAFTSKEITGYYVKAAKEYFDKSLDIVSDILTSPLLSAEEIEKEKGVVVQEIRMRNDDPVSRTANIFEQLLWGDQPAGWEVAGDEKTVNSLRREDFADYFYSQYVASNTVVVVAGAYPQDAEKRIEQEFKTLKKGKARSETPTKSLGADAKVRVENKDVESSNLVLGLEGYNMHHPKRFILSMLGVVLGGNVSSRLFTEVREKRGLAYYIGAGNTLYKDGGYFEISAGVPHDKTETALEVIVRELQKIKTDGVSAEELKRAKDYIRGSTKISLESSSALASYFGEQVVFEKKIMTPEENLKKLDRVSAPQIKALARELFQPQRSALALVGRAQSEPGFLKILKQI
ncbi:MAG: pitrilysin family protein [bacterium]|nr:pitrilysin family protein [bacterium]